jgi:hypothetical protein
MKQKGNRAVVFRVAVLCCNDVGELRLRDDEGRTK